MIDALRKLIIAWMASILFALWSGAVFLAGFGARYLLTLHLLAIAK